MSYVSECGGVLTAQIYVRFYRCHREEYKEVYMRADEYAQTVGGYVFRTEKEAKLARAEEHKIKYLEERIDYDTPDSIRYIYEKAIQDRIFKTPIGLRYLKHLQDFLLEQSQIDAATVPAIPLEMSFGAEQLRPAGSVRRAGGQDADRRKSAFVISVISNILLAIAICAMFAISLKSDQPNIFNYEKALLNKYSVWAQELTEREQAVRDKELELKLNQ